MGDFSQLSPILTRAAGHFKIEHIYQSSVARPLPTHQLDGPSKNGSKPQAHSPVRRVGDFPPRACVWASTGHFPRRRPSPASLQRRPSTVPSPPRPAAATSPQTARWCWSPLPLGDKLLRSLVRRWEAGAAASARRRRQSTSAPRVARPSEYTHTHSLPVVRGYMLPSLPVGLVFQ
jgi:hypothetical protein